MKCVRRKLKKKKKADVIVPLARLLILFFFLFFLSFLFFFLLRSYLPHKQKHKHTLSPSASRIDSTPSFRPFLFIFIFFHPSVEEIWNGNIARYSSM
ncbi:hypothetical protein, unlikely [Trypanosoma brucei brucei TREU927]|uniref:T. brucei spp.-specific protein n=1 Tax=Trypanosoma brucei brucei (strain 927/4 GUTat10.1) TaxID=185431 RepID=Q38FC9_TRYB2|nr:hypothetical protein, unlikely [Trypanosoma brucei brucei TREU927]EAN76491.1 hypothetical protein, unlikely [Trypanosoma brucei brucei TREU927]